MFASISAHFARVASAVVTELILLLLTGRDGFVSSLDLLLFLRGTRVSNPVVDVEVILPISASSLSSTIYVSSSIKVPLHSGEDSMVRTYVFSSITIAPTAPTTSASAVVASNAAPASASADGAPKSSIPSTGFVAAASSPYSSS